MFPSVSFLFRVIAINHHHHRHKPNPQPKSNHESPPIFDYSFDGSRSPPTNFNPLILLLPHNTFGTHTLPSNPQFPSFLLLLLVSFSRHFNLIGFSLPVSTVVNDIYLLGESSAPPTTSISASSYPIVMYLLLLLLLLIIPQHGWLKRFKFTLDATQFNNDARFCRSPQRPHPLITE